MENLILIVSGLSSPALYIPEFHISLIKERSEKKAV